MKISLISMPFVDLKYPSLGLTQLKAAVDRALGIRVSCTIHYLYHDFAAWAGVDFYNYILGQLPSGLGEWLFRPIAFPGAPDNSDAYYACYYPQNDATTAGLKAAIRKLRSRLEYFFTGLIMRYQLAAADLVGFSSVFFQNAASLGLARILKNIKQDLITVMGGANADYPMGSTLLNQVNCLDYIFSGPGLVSFPRFLEYCLAGRPAGAAAIDGVYGRLLPADKCYGETSDINLSGELDYDSFLDSYTTHFPAAAVKPYLFFTTSRGCYRGAGTPCTFCAQAGPGGNKMDFTAMSPDIALHTIRSLFRYKNRVQLFYAADSILAPGYPERVFANLASPVPIHFELNVQHMNSARIRLLSAAGVKVTEAGIESLSTESLRLMHKGTTASRNLRFMMDCLLSDLFVTWNFLLGFPGEHAALYEKIFHALPLLTHFPPPHVTPVAFERYSVYHKNPAAYGLQLQPYAFYYFTYPFAKSIVGAIAYHFDNLAAAPYKEGLARWVDKIIARCHDWDALWDRNRQSFPCLYLEHRRGSSYIVDSRTGITKEYVIDRAAVSLLSVLQIPRSMPWLLCNFREGNARAGIENLCQKDLLFDDEGKYFSLVFPAKPPVPSYFGKRN